MGDIPFVVGTTRRHRPSLVGRVLPKSGNRCRQVQRLEEPKVVSEMKIHKPRIEIEFFQEPEPRSTYVVLMLSGGKVICDNPEDALAVLVAEVDDYLKAMRLIPLQDDE